ncbi:hypothetical protein Tco_1538218 [Tanacetum coccineum]
MWPAIMSEVPRWSSRRGDSCGEIIAELLDVAQGVTSIIVGTIIVIHEEEGWWYIGYKGCKKKVIRSYDMVDLEADVPKKTSSCKDD